MPTLNKLEYLDETKQQIKNALNQFGVGITSDDTFRSYVSKISDIYNNWARVEGEGTSLNLTPTKKGKMSLNLVGNTTQEDTPTPDNPVPIKKVTGNNTITIKNQDNTLSQTYPINLGSLEYCKIGNYSDEFYLDNGNWYIRRNIGKVVLDGTEAWYYQPTQARLRWQWTLGTRSNLGYCDSYVVDVNLTNDFTINIQNSNIFIKDSRHTSSTSFKEWLTTNNVYFYYVLATPTSEPITDETLISQLNNLLNATSYDNQTNISQVNDDLPFIINAGALMKGGN